MADELERIAKDRAAGAKHRAAQLKREIADLERTTAEKKTQLEAANLAPDRLANYSARIGIDYRCPLCWMDHGRHATLRPIGGGTDMEDFFRCNSCKQEYGISVGR